MAAEKRSLSTRYFGVDAQVSTTHVDGGHQIVAAIFVRRKRPGGPEFDWDAPIRSRLITAIEDGLVALECRVREESRNGNGVPDDAGR